jgi:hypothetical protein
LEAYVAHGNYFAKTFGDVNQTDIRHQLLASLFLREYEG